MVMIVLRATGASFDVRSFLSRHKLQVDGLWEVGKPFPTRKSRPSDDSGFNLTLAESEDCDSAMIRAVSALEGRLKNAVRELGKLGVACEVDLGLTVGDEDHFTSHARVTRRHLTALARLGLDLIVSAYPVEAKVS